MANQKYLAKKEFGHIQLSRTLCKLINEVKNKEQGGRYAINRLRVGENKFTVTDGRRLLILDFKHEFGDGLYFITCDGYCLKDDGAGEFPTNYKEIIPTEIKLVWENSWLDTSAIFEAIYELTREGIRFNFDMLMPVLRLLEKLNAHEIRIEVSKADTAQQPFVIRGNIRDSEPIVHFTYIQMPMLK